MSTQSEAIIDDFVNIMSIDTTEDEPALSVNIIPRHDTIGRDAPMTSTEFCTTVTARNLPENDESMRAPVDIVVVLDVSGSMTGRKLQLCKDTIQLLLRELMSNDRFGLVTFGDDANLIISTTKLTTQNREAAMMRVKSLSTNGCTNMSGGIGLAAQELTNVENPHDVRTIFLLTDGHANRGVIDRAGITDLTRNCLRATGDKQSISIHCFGYGVDHDREMLGAISNATEGGSYYFVENDSDVSSAFGDALGGVLSVVAQNTVVNIKAVNKGGSILNVHHDKAKRNIDGSYNVALGDFYAEESRDIIIQSLLGVPQDDINLSDLPHIAVTVSYLDTINKRIINSSELVGSIKRPHGNVVSKTNNHVALQSIRIRTTNVISTAEGLAENNNFVQARSTIYAHIDFVQREAALLEESTNPLVLQILSELKTMLDGLSSSHKYKTVGAKYMQIKNTSYSRQRCYESNEAAVNTFRSSRKRAVANKLMMLSKK